MPEIIINSIPIDFPYTPYGCQLKYMEKVIDCLNNRFNGLLESPTGTGKTLCLLCATLGWLQYKKNLVNDEQHSNTNLSKSTMNNINHGQSNQFFSKIIYSSRTHTQLVQVLKELKKTKYANSIDAALLASREQYCIHPQVSKEENNFLKIQKCRGKVHHRTCHFYNNLTNIFTSTRPSSKSRLLGENLPKVPDIEDLVEFGRSHRVCPYYSSRELAKTADLVLMPYNYLVDKSSRRGRTLNNKPDQSTGSSDQLIRGAVLIFDEAHNLEKFCEEAASLEMGTGDVAGALVELDEIVDRYTSILRQSASSGRPFYTSNCDGSSATKDDQEAIAPDFSLEELARVKEIFMGLEEALDSLQIPAGPDSQTGRVVSVDYLYELLNDKLKLDRNSAMACVSLLDRITNHIAVNSDLHSSVASGGRPTSKYFAAKNTKGFDQLGTLLKTAYGFDQEIPTETETIKGPETRNVAELSGLRASLKAKFDLFSFDNAAINSNRLSRCNPQKDMHNNMKHFKLHVRYDTTRSNKAKVGGWTVPLIKSSQPKILSLWCFSPSHTIQELFKAQIRCLILTSGTLSPINSFGQAMNVDFAVQLENEHIIDSDQLLVATLPKGPDGTILNSSFKNRNSEKYMNSLGMCLLNFARMIPSGVLLFFPSYSQMATVIEFWKGSSLWTSIEKYKPVFMEPKTKDKLSQEIKGYYESIDGSSGPGKPEELAQGAAILIGVCRGKISEGYDFSDHYGRAVIIAGIPYPSRHEPRIALKIQFMNERARASNGAKNASTMVDGNTWYQLEASRAVNQAIGRVIRHKRDYGAILLCDERFSHASRRADLSKWIQPFVQNYDTSKASQTVPGNSGFGGLLSRLKTFFGAALFKYPLDRLLPLSEESHDGEKKEDSGRRKKRRNAMQLGSGTFLNEDWLSQYRKNKVSPPISLVPETQDHKVQDSGGLTEEDTTTSLFTQMRQLYNIPEPSASTTREINKADTALNEPLIEKLVSVSPVSSKYHSLSPKSPIIELRPSQNDNASNGPPLFFSLLDASQNMEALPEKKNDVSGGRCCPKLYSCSIGKIPIEDDVQILQEFTDSIEMGKCRSYDIALAKLLGHHDDKWFEVCTACRHFERVAHHGSHATSNRNKFRIDQALSESIERELNFEDLADFLQKCKEILAQEYHTFCKAVRQYKLDGVVETLIYSLRQIFPNSTANFPYISFVNRYFLRSREDIMMFERHCLPFYSAEGIIKHGDISDLATTIPLIPNSISPQDEQGKSSQGESCRLPLKDIDTYKLVPQNRTFPWFPKITERQPQSASAITASQINCPDRAPDLKKRARRIKSYEDRGKKKMNDRLQPSIIDHFRKK